jgi:hypothetical protein
VAVSSTAGGAECNFNGVLVMDGVWKAVVLLSSSRRETRYFIMVRSCNERRDEGKKSAILTFGGENI